MFLSETEDLFRLGDYGTVVIDAQYFTKEEIAAAKAEIKADKAKAKQAE